MEYEDIKILARKVVEEMHNLHSADLAPKWEDATIIFKPADPDMQEHEMEISKLLHKIVMVRDNLRVLEQQINSNKNLNESEKVKLQNYITRSYGSLTSFNFLFQYPEDKFSSK